MSITACSSEQVDADHVRALAREELRGCGADAAPGAGDHAHLALQPSAHDVAKKIVLTSV
jgi:hypothetical protein